MVLQYCDGGNLLSYQAKLKNKCFPVSEAVEILVEVMKGLKEVHQRDYIHRDIKSENVLIKNTQKGKQYKIADFGFARPLKSGNARTVCGTEKYMAPEILENVPYTIAVDIWAMGVLLYFMLFAEYPFKGFDILADIKKKCYNGFSLRDVVSKKDKLKECGPEVEDFFKRIFVIDHRKRITFSKMTSHPLFKSYEHEFTDTRNFYTTLENAVKQHAPEPMDPDSQDEDEDDTRADLMVQEVVINQANKNFEREIEFTGLEVGKIIYLWECSVDFYQNYKAVLPLPERLAVRYYVLRAFMFYANNLLPALEERMMPRQLMQYKFERWKEFIDTKEYGYFLNTLKLAHFHAKQQMDDTYEQLIPLVSALKIKNFMDKFTPQVTETEFEQFKVSYRSTTSHIFKLIHENKNIDSHLKNKIKMRLFCCHMINRIFDQNEIETNFEYYYRWLKKSGYNSNSFEFTNFKKWIMSESKENLDKNILLLHRIFFSK